MFESLAWVSSKLLKVTEAEARSQQLLHLSVVCSHPRSSSHFFELLVTQGALNLPSTAVKPSGITTHVPEGEHCNNVVQIVPASKF